MLNHNYTMEELEEIWDRYLDLGSPERRPNTMLAAVQTPGHPLFDDRFLTALDLIHEMKLFGFADRP